MQIYIIHDEQGQILGGGTSPRVLSGEVTPMPAAHQRFHIIDVADAPDRELHTHLRKLFQSHRVQTSGVTATLVSK